MTNVVVYIRNHYILYGNNSKTTIYCAYHPDKAVKPMSQQPMYRLHAFIGRSGSLRAQTNAYIAGGTKPIGWDIFDRSLCLPSDNKMTAEEQDRIIQVIRACFE